MNIKEVHNWLIAEGYLVNDKNKFKPSARYYEAVTGLTQGIVVQYPLTIAHATAKPVEDWQARYLQFIADAEIPRSWVSSNGTPYDLNKFSKDGLKAFKEAMTKDRVEYPLLVKATMLYYKSTNAYKQTISNYMVSGSWKTDYLALKEASGSEQTLIAHLKQSTQNNGTAYEIG